MNSPTAPSDARSAIETAIAALQSAQRDMEEGLKLQPTTDADRAFRQALKKAHDGALHSELSLRLALRETPRENPVPVAA